MEQTDVWYHLYPIGFLDAEAHNPSPGTPSSSSAPRVRRLTQLVKWLDYLVELGIDGLLLGPIFESESHGYDIVDPFRIDQRLGDEGDLLELVEECHSRSIRIGLDLVFNHVGRAHPYFADVVSRKRHSTHCDWFQLDFEKPGYDGFWYENFEGIGQLVKLNHQNPEVLEWAVSVASHWQERGIDAFRLDAAYAIPPKFLARLATRIRQLQPDLLLIGEVIHGDYVRLVNSSSLSTVTQYELWKAIWSALNDRNFYELAHALERHADFSEHFPPWNFVGNHDTTRIATRLNEPRHIAHALVVLLSVPGIPAIYAGDEQGAQGTKYEREGGDDEIRKPLRHHPDQILRNQPAVWQRHQQLIRLRKQYPWLAGGQLSVVQLNNELLVYRIRSSENQLFVALSIQDRPAEIRIPANFKSIAGLANSAGDKMVLPPQGWCIWVGRADNDRL